MAYRLTSLPIANPPQCKHCGYVEIVLRRLNLHAHEVALRSASTAATLK